MRYIISPEIRAEAVVRYLAGDRPKNIAIALGIKDWNISCIMRRAGLARNQVDAQQLILSRKEWGGNTQYTVTHSAFSNITPDSAYWAGFLMADGFIANNKVRLGLSIKDMSHLEKFRVFTGSNAPIMEKKAYGRVATINGRVIRDNGSAFITVVSGQITRDLAALGVTKRKTFTARASESMEMNRDFWRGAVDGDGTFVGSRGKPYLRLLGTEDLMIQFRAFCRSIVKTGINVRPVGNIFSLQMSSGVAYAVLKALYQDATTALDRKADKARIILDSFSHYGHVGYL